MLQMKPEASRQQVFGQTACSLGQRHDMHAAHIRQLLHLRVGGI